MCPQYERKDCCWTGEGVNDKTENWILGDAQVNPFTDRAHVSWQRSVLRTRTNRLYLCYYSVMLLCVTQTI